MSAKYLRYMTIGRRVWVREGPKWIGGSVYSIHNSSLIVRIDGGEQREVYVHYSVLHRDIRVNKPKA